ncbi:hypothetical protein SGRIM128S_02713 [Streptomyces griseomycini]
MTDPRTTVVVITHNRCGELLRTLDRLAGLPEKPPVIVTDNGSTDGTARAVARHHPRVRLLRPGRNLGAVGRNLAVREVRTPYVAFCDDDSWWSPGSLTGAADLLDRHPALGSVTARIIVEPDGTDDPIVRELRDSPVPGPPWLPGPALGSFLAAAHRPAHRRLPDRGRLPPEAVARRRGGTARRRPGVRRLVAGLRRSPDDPPPGPLRRMRTPRCAGCTASATPCGSPGCAVRPDPRCAAPWTSPARSRATPTSLRAFAEAAAALPWSPARAPRPAPRGRGAGLRRLEPAQQCLFVPAVTRR